MSKIIGIDLGTTNSCVAIDDFLARLRGVFENIRSNLAAVAFGRLGEGTQLQQKKY